MNFCTLEKYVILSLRKIKHYITWSEGGGKFSCCFVCETIFVSCV